MGCCAHLFSSLDQRSGTGKISYRRILHRGKVQAGPVETHGSGGDQHVANVDVRLDCASGAHAQESADAQLRQLFNGDRGRRAADPGGADNHRFAIYFGAPGGKFAMRCQLNRLIHQRGDLFHSLRIARDDCQRGSLQIVFGQAEVKNIRLGHG